MRRADLTSVEEYMARPYRIEVYRDEDYWAAEFPDLSGLVAGHETWEGLQDAIEDAKHAYFEAAIRDGRPLPLPAVRQEDFSGKLVLRLSKSLHRRAARAAEREGVSLNSFLSTALARELGVVETKEQLEGALMLFLNRGSTSFTAHSEDGTGKIERWFTAEPIGWGQSWAWVAQTAKETVAMGGR